MFLSIFKMMLNAERCSVLPSYTVICPRSVEERTSPGCRYMSMVCVGFHYLFFQKADLESETLREETAEELALVVSPQTRRAPSPLLGPPPHLPSSPTGRVPKIRSLVY
jgi:hypothetical protein